MPSEVMQKHHLKTRRVAEVTELICRDCHKTIHGLFGNNEIRTAALGLDTLDGILGHDAFQKALTFIRKVPPGAFMKMHGSNQRGRRK